MICDEGYIISNGDANHDVCSMNGDWFSPIPTCTGKCLKLFLSQQVWICLCSPDNLIVVIMTQEVKILGVSP